jgi:DNA polymerase-3 subunit gamma/tau
LTGFSMTLLRMLAFMPGEPPGPGRRSAIEGRSQPGASAAGQRAAPAAVQTVQAGALAANEPLEGFDGNWRRLAEGLPGLVRQLAMQCELAGHDQRGLCLRLPSGQQTLLAGFGDKLKAALAERLGAQVRVDIEVVEEAGTTSPAAQRAREAADRQSEAEAAIRADPFVQTLVRECEASINNIRPLTGTGN